MLAINAIKELGDAQPPELFFSEHYDGVNSLDILVEQRSLSGDRSLDRNAAWVLFCWQLSKLAQVLN